MDENATLKENMRELSAQVDAMTGGGVNLLLKERIRMLEQQLTSFQSVTQIVTKKGLLIGELQDEFTEILRILEQTIPPLQEDPGNEKLRNEKTERRQKKRKRNKRN